MKNINLFNVDVANLRSERQKYNDQIVFNLLRNKTTFESIKKNINTKALDRIINEDEISYDQIIEKCHNDVLYAKSMSRNISINASRQGKIDEKLIIDGIGSVVSNFNIKISTCDVNSIRFLNDGRVLDSKSFKKENLDKDIHSMKSIDAIIEGKINGYIFAKVVIGGGGHQDNVLSESIKFIEWVNKYGNSDKLYVVLVDGEELDKIKIYEKDNLWIVNHIDLQKKLIEFKND